MSQQYGCFRGMTAAARHRKNGSKSKKCCLPSDGMTAAQWKKRNGEVMSYNLNKPMSYEAFKDLPEDAKRTYLKHLCEVHGASVGGLAEMFGVSRSTIGSIVSGLGIKFSAGMVTNERKRKWAEFLAPNEDVSSALSSEDKEEDADLPKHNMEEDEQRAMQMDRLSMSFIGVVDISTIANSLRKVFGDSVSGHVEISCTM